MGNGDDAIDLVRTQDEQAIRRARAWDEGIESDHDHGPLIDGMESVMNVSVITMKRMKEHGERLDRMATKEDIEKMVSVMNGRNGSGSGSIRTKKINVLGLFSFAGYTMHDVIRFLILITMMIALYMIFDVKNHLSHMGEDFTLEEILTTEESE